MRKLIIHIGAHKTGSTAIQKFLFEYAKYFEENFNFIYPIEKQVNPKFGFWGHHYLTWYFTPKKKELDLNILNLAFNSFINQISLYREKDFLISSEDFTWNNKVDEFINHLRDFFDEIFVLMYFRRQVDAALSLYQTGVVNEGYTMSFYEWFDNAKPLFDYYAIAERFEKAGCKIVLRPFIRDKFDSREVILDFLKSVSQILERPIIPPESFKPGNIRVNISLPDFICLMIRYYNAQPSKDKVVPVLKELGHKLINLMPELPTTDLIPPSHKNKIIEIYKESNKLLCEKYVGVEFLDWLNKEIDESDALFNERFGFSGSQLVELSKTFIKVIEEFNKKKLEVQKC